MGVLPRALARIRHGGFPPGHPIHERRARHPAFAEAVLADARLALANRAERFEFRSRADGWAQVARLVWSSDAFGAQVLYRLKAHCQARGIPVVPRVAHRLAMASAQVCIGDPVVIEPGFYLAHGQVVIDGLTEIGAGTVIFPWVTIGLRGGAFSGPTVGGGVKIGSGAKIVGDVRIGNGAKIGANAVVVEDVPARATAVGVPARIIEHRPAEGAAVG